MASKRDVEIADTLPPEPEDDEPADLDAPATPLEPAKQTPRWDGPAAPPGDRPPVTGWDRYELLELLGKGGMGSVYKARDRRLGRIVAIKFIQSANPNLTMRFLQEARAQARIDHPNVCRVYEADEVEGRAYIALQYIDGEPLPRAATRMSLDEKVAALREVAVAVHEAHRLGIVHRDLKPGNVLVERRDDGRWVPIVMDFGLAREATVEVGITESGVPLGTPAYMSPEQARGDIHAIDRRSDVYGLGATLYELLTGQLPFPTSSVAEAFQRAIHDDPPHLRSHVPELPVDLETIALKCLAKDPAQRYPSARALADDLGRYLDGEPILGRREPWWQRLRRRARRQRALVTLGAVSLVAIGAIATLGIRERVLAGDRARLAERLGREATEIESELRIAYLRPLHDTRPDRTHVRDRMRAIAATQHDLGEFGDALVHDALGRGHLALHQWREAADELARAADRGLQTPELHAARGRALGELYRRALEDLRSAPAGNAAWLAEQQQALAQRYLTPALDELRQSRASGDEAALLEARIALYSDDFAAAEHRAREIAGRATGSSEALELAADAAYRAAVQAFDHGDYASARQGIEGAAALYGRAIDIARSDASLYLAAAEAWLQLAEVDFRQKRSPAESLDRAQDAIDHGALRADPDNASAYTTMSYVLLRRRPILSLAGQSDQRPLLDQAAHAAARAVELAPRDAQAWIAFGNAHIYRGRYELDNGGAAADWLTHALDELGKALAIEPGNQRAHTDLGRAHHSLGTSLEKAGQDPLPEYQMALHSHEHAADIDPSYLPACTNQVDVYVSIADYDNAIGEDPRAAVDRAQRIGARCLTIDPHFYRLHDNLAQAELAAADYLVETGGDPTVALTSARAALARAEAAQFDQASVWYHRLQAANTEAEFRLRRGADPAGAISAARDALNTARQLVPPDSAYLSVEAARLLLTEARWAAHTGRSPLAALEQARSEADHALEIDHDLVMAKCTAAEVYWQLAMVQSSRAARDHGLQLVREALALNPRLSQARAIGAALQQLSIP